MAGRIPLAVKLAFTAFMAVLVPVYWANYGPRNFLYFCDTALFFTLAALWLESSLLASIPAVGIVGMQIFWQVDFVAHFFDMTLTGVTDYMFKSSIPIFARFLSFFHYWLPLLLLWMVWRLGYDRRALAIWTIFAAVNLLVCYYWMPPPSARAADSNEAANINYVFGIDANKPQEWMDPILWLAMLVFGMPLVFYLPVHLALSWLFKRPGKLPWSR